MSSAKLEYGDCISVLYEGEKYKASVVRTKMIFGEPRVEVVSGSVETWFHFDEVSHIIEKYENRREGNHLPMLGERFRLEDSLPVEAGED